jgi:hypothetical protein
VPANTSPLFPVTPVAGIAQISVANSALTGGGTVVTVYTPGANGGRIEYIRVKAVAATTAGMVRLFINDGSNTRLWKEISVSAITPSATVQSFEAEFVPTKPLVLPSGYTLKASTENGETFNVVAFGGDF